jgi:hypothetical protein
LKSAGFPVGVFWAWEDKEMTKNEMNNKMVFFMGLRFGIQDK